MKSNNRSGQAIIDVISAGYKIYGAGTDSQAEDKVLFRDRGPELRQHSLIDAVPDLVAALQEVEEYLDDRADVIDGDYGQPRPNREMQLLTEVRAAIRKATRGGK